MSIYSGVYTLLYIMYIYMYIKQYHHGNHTYRDYSSSPSQFGFRSFRKQWRKAKELSKIAFYAKISPQKERLLLKSA